MNRIGCRQQQTIRLRIYTAQCCTSQKHQRFISDYLYKENHFQQCTLSVFFTPANLFPLAICLKSAGSVTPETYEGNSTNLGQGKPCALAGTWHPKLQQHECRVPATMLRNQLASGRGERNKSSVTRFLWSWNFWHWLGVGGSLHRAHPNVKTPAQYSGTLNTNALWGRNTKELWIRNTK